MNTKLIENSEIKTVSENFLTIPGKPASVIPEVPVQEIKLPLFLKQDVTYYRIDEKESYLSVYLGQYYKHISLSQFDSIPNSFISAPDKYEIITEAQFNEAFTSALSAIATAHGSLVTVSRPPEPEDFDDTDYGEDDERRHDVWMAEQEDNFLNPDLP